MWDYPRGNGRLPQTYPQWPIILSSQQPSGTHSSSAVCVWEGASYKPITIHAGFSLVWSCVDNHSDCKSMCVLVLLCPERSVWHYPFPPTEFYSLSASSLASLEICVGGSWYGWFFYFGHLKSHVLSTFTSSPQGYDLPSLGLLSRFTLPDKKLSSKDQASTLIRKWLVTPSVFMPRSQLWPHLPWQVGINVYRFSSG